MKDFFISYNREDKQWASWIAYKLEEAGYTTVIQAWDFRAGGDFVMEMQKAATGTRKTIAVLSENYLSAAFTQPEWANAFARDPKGNDRVLIPIRVAACKSTGLLATRIYVDLVGLSEEQARECLLDSLKERGKPDQSPPFPDSPDRPAMSRNRAPHDATSSKDTKFPGTASSAIDVWREKLQFLQAQEPLAVSAEEKFALKKQIEEARQKITEMDGISVPVAVTPIAPTAAETPIGELDETDAVSYSRQLARKRLEPFAAKVLNSAVTRKLILTHNNLKADMAPEDAAAYLLESDEPMKVLFNCVGHDLPIEDREELTSSFWSLVETVTPVCLVVTSQGDLSEHLNGRISHVGVTTNYSEVGKSLVGTIKCLPVDLGEPGEFSELCHADLPDGRDKVASVPHPPDLGAFQDVNPRDKNRETIVSVFEEGLKRYLNPRTTVKAALATRAARGIVICVLMRESPGVENLAALNVAFPDLVVLVSQPGSENQNNDNVLEQIDQIKEWLKPNPGQKL